MVLGLVVLAGTRGQQTMHLAQLQVVASQRAHFDRLANRLVEADHMVTAVVGREGLVHGAGKVGDGVALSSL